MITLLKPEGGSPATPYMNEIVHGDCLEKLRRLPNNSIDLVVTDPPYGLKFMGKDWDKAIPSVEIWKECLRVLKPGAFACIMSAPRQDLLSRMIVTLGDAGFEIGFTSLYWTYATGFPKAYNISKCIDKRAGVEREVLHSEMRIGLSKTARNMPKGQRQHKLCGVPPNHMNTKRQSLLQN